MTRLDHIDIQPICDALDDARQPTGWSRHKMFTTWIDLVLATLQHDDDAYLSHVETIERDTDPQPVLNAVARAFGALLYETASTNADVLGAVYERFGLTSDAFGQHFTPPNVALSMARIQLGTIEPDRHTREDPLQIGDPTCGSGRMLLAAGRLLAQEAPETPVLFVGQDKDPRCAQMTAINFALAELPGYVTQGDSLAPPDDDAAARATWKIMPSRGLDVGPI